MLCSGCGKNIPFNGDVCPYCQRDKIGDQQMQALSTFFGMIGGAIGWLISGLGATIIGVLVGVVVGITLAKKAGAGKSQAPDVRVVEHSEFEKSTQESSSIATRLVSLEHLKSKNLISESEFNAKRQEILEKL